MSDHKFGFAEYSAGVIVSFFLLAIIALPIVLIVWLYRKYK